MERIKLLTLAVVGLALLNLLTIGFLVLTSGPGADWSGGADVRNPESNRHLTGPASRGPSNPERRTGGPARIIIQRLRFDAQQQERYRERVAAHQQQTQTLRQESVRLYRDYYGLVAAARPDTARANGLSRQIAEIHRALAQVNFDHFRDIKALCRPDQQADFARLVGELSRLFGRPPHPARPGASSENLPPHP